MKRIVPIAVAGLLASAFPVYAQQDWRPWRMHEWMGREPGWFGPLMLIAWLSVLVAVTVLIVRWLGGTGASGAKPERTARDILDERYARGEIDREEYLRRRQDIEGH